MPNKKGKGVKRPGAPSSVSLPDQNLVAAGFPRSVVEHYSAAQGSAAQGSAAQGSAAQGSAAQGSAAQGSDKTPKQESATTSTQNFATTSTQEQDMTMTGGIGLGIVGSTTQDSPSQDLDKTPKQESAPIPKYHAAWTPRYKAPTPRVESSTGHDSALPGRYPTPMYESPTYKSAPTSTQEPDMTMAKGKGMDLDYFNFKSQTHMSKQRILQDNPESSLIDLGPNVTYEEIIYASESEELQKGEIHGLASDNLHEDWQPYFLSGELILFLSDPKIDKDPSAEPELFPANAPDGHYADVLWWMTRCSDCLLDKIFWGCLELCWVCLVIHCQCALVFMALSGTGLSSLSRWLLTSAAEMFLGVGPWIYLD